MKPPPITAVKTAHAATMKPAAEAAATAMKTTAATTAATMTTAVKGIDTRNGQVQGHECRPG